MNTPVLAARSGPRRARLKVRPPAARQLDIELCFNPTEYQVQKANAFAVIAIPGLEAPPVQFIRGESEKLSVELLADTTDSGEDVRTRYTDPIRALLDLDPILCAPPIVDFHWDQGLFTGVVENVTFAFQLFDPDGVPLRAKISLTLMEYRPLLQQVVTKAAGIGASYLVQAGETLSSIAARTIGDATQWRELAKANDIADARTLEPGVVLAIPKRSSLKLGKLF